MDGQNGLGNQINKLEPVQFKPLTMKDLTETLIKTLAKPVNYNSIYMGSDTYDVFGEILHEKNFINVYGIKQLGKQGGLFVYEGVLFDKFPKEYNMLFVDFLNKQGLERCEEIEIIELTDTKIVFKGSFRLPADINNFIIEGD